MTTYPIKIKSGLHNSQGKTYTTLIKELAIQGSQAIVSGQAALTDSSTGVAAGSVVTLAPVNFVDTVLGSNNLATKASVETGLGNVQDALNELYTKANAYATKLSVNNVTYNGGGAAADGTIGAIAKATTGGTTAPATANLLPIVVAYNNAFVELVDFCNQLAIALGKPNLTVALSTPYVYLATVPALTTGTGNAVAPGVANTDATNILTAYANNVATIAAFLNTLNTGVIARVVVVR